MKYSSKKDLIRDIEEQHEALVALLESIPRARWREAGVWGDGWTVQDLVAHLLEWQLMLLRWVREGSEGQDPELPAPGYRWSQTPELNQAIWRKHRRRSGARIRAEFEASYQEILALARSLPPRVLLRPGQVRWTGSSTLATYLAASSASHHRTACKILKRWLRGGRRPS